MSATSERSSGLQEARTFTANGQKNGSYVPEDDDECLCLQFPRQRNIRSLRCALIEEL